jgi:tRNA A-37 threonylcarbamoyl transferase component Bud32
MNSARWQRIEELFHAAMDRDPKDRDAFLTNACGTDTELLHEVQSLLVETEKHGDFMDRPAMEVEAESISKQPAGALAGRFIAHYHMGPLVGTGGMAEVYRAHDTTLDRDVAIKVLLGSSCRDPETFGRFQREARLLAAVTHPNIAAVYGFEQVDDQCALVMEMIEGETLSARIQREHLSLDEFLSFASQIAAGIEAAHAKGIVHRDLKPSNIRITRDGTIKVLDFGVAKIFHPLGGADDVTLSFFETKGIPIIGTVAYMSPEQARGKPVDTRSDIWALGCVMYEMLTNTRAFEGNTWTDTIARITGESPDWSRLPNTTPPDIRTLLHDCLEKEPERRIRHVGELRRRLENALRPKEGSVSEGEIAISREAARRLFLFIQIGYLAMYCGALFYRDSVDAVVVPVVTIVASCGIAVRLYLISSVALAHPDAGVQFRRLFPVLLLLDAGWAAAPILIRALSPGVALAAAAGLAYLPFSQRTLMHRIYS